jgi:ubiquinone/menaquinone biosynthesis C-methylase UbiE
MGAVLKSNQEWKEWGRVDPLWAVASWAGKQGDGAAPWTAAEFYALGESDWKDFRARWERYGMDTRRCVEIGCGAGRMTKALSGTFDSVLGIDVSEDMIRLARAAAPENASFSTVDDPYLPVPDESVSAVFSTHVLQHMESVEAGYVYFREAYRALCRDGTLMVHLPLYQFPQADGRMGAVWQRLYSLLRKFDDLRAARQRSRGARIMRGTPYPIRPLWELLRETGFRDIEYSVFAVTSNEDLHPFVFARK